MEEQIARALVRSLLERLEADARRSDPQFLAAVSHLEREAIGCLLNAKADNPSAGIAREAQQTVEVLAEHVQLGAEAVPPEMTGSPSFPTVEEYADGEDLTSKTVPDLEPLSSIDSELKVGPRQEAPRLDETSVSRQSVEDPDCVLCLDFGTAKSKAFAALSRVADDPEPELIELGLGRRDGDEDAIYTVASSVWVSDDGLLYAGSEAMRQSLEAVAHGTHRRRLDSIKQKLTLASYQQRLSARLLEPELNPSEVQLTYEDAICFFLACFTDLATSELTERGRSRYMRRRFTIPAWQPAQRAWAASALANYVVRAQILADTFHGKWQAGIPAEHWKSRLAEAAAVESQAAYLLDNATGRNGILEPLAAGSGRVWADTRAKNLVFVLDVGAGTTDFSLFWVVQNIPGGSCAPRRAYQVAPYSDAIAMAGDFIDETLLELLLDRAFGKSDKLLRHQFETDLRLRGMRRLKERLFTAGKIDVSLLSGQSIVLQLDEFLANDQVKAIEKEIEGAVQRFLDSADESWTSVLDNAQIVLTGGGASMPNIEALADRVWKLGGQPVRFKRVPSVPDLIEKNYDDNFQREYPQLAVAIGGALPVLDEKSRMEKYWGKSTSLGPLSKYPVTGPQSGW
jgi:molecular chaperone HscA